MYITAEEDLGRNFLMKLFYLIENIYTYFK